jgi:hypothetical protein
MAVTIFLIITFLPLVIEAVRQTRRLSIDGLMMMNVSFAIIYGYSGLINTISEEHSGRLSSDSVIVAVLCFIGYISVLASYAIVFHSTKVRPASEATFRVSNTRILTGAYVAFLLGLVSVYFYARSYGGMGNALQYAAVIRSGYGEDYLNGAGLTLFFKRFIPVLQYLPIIALSLFLERRRLIYLIIFSASALITIFGLFIMAGRGRIVIFTLLLVISSITYFNKNRKLSIANTIALILVIFLTDVYITYGKDLFNYQLVEGGSINNILHGKPYILFQTFVEYYQHRIDSIFVAISETEFGPTWFYDSFAIPTYLIPTRLTGITGPPSISYINTYLLTGDWDSMIPPGMIAYGFYSMGVIGVVLTSAVYAVLPALLDKRAGSSPPKSMKVFIRTPAVFIWVVYYLQGDPRVFIINMFPLLVFMLLIYLARVHLVPRRVGHADE